MKRADVLLGNSCLNANRSSVLAAREDSGDNEKEKITKGVSIIVTKRNLRQKI